ncbi:hypothetical protein B0H14DRAFT_2632705 [Mycena olivaceomarginata]|nr:hypothetical protein B0H14DRAFT_2632705 [Mycena olivaceomarginata]
MNKKYRPKIKLFSVDQEDVKPNLAGTYTIAERRARSILIQKQRAQLVEEAGYTRMLHQISLLNELTDGASARALARAHRLEVACKTVRDDARRRQIDIRCRLEREERLQSHPRPPPPPPPKNRTRPVPKQGKREQRAQPLSADDLYLDDVRPLSVSNPSILHTCILCFNAKSHPVFCRMEITRKPVAHDVEAAAIERAHHNWDQSSVAYSWDGLSFPWANRIITTLSSTIGTMPTTVADAEKFRLAVKKTEGKWYLFAGGLMLRNSLTMTAEYFAEMADKKIYFVVDGDCSIYESMSLKTSLVPMPKTPGMRWEIYKAVFTQRHTLVTRQTVRHVVVTLGDAPVTWHQYCLPIANAAPARVLPAVPGQGDARRVKERVSLTR